MSSPRSTADTILSKVTEIGLKPNPNANKYARAWLIFAGITAAVNDGLLSSVGVGGYESVIKWGLFGLTLLSNQCAIAESSYPWPQEDNGNSSIQSDMASPLRPPGATDEEALARAIGGEEVAADEKSCGTKTKERLTRWNAEKDNFRFYGRTLASAAGACVTGFLTKSIGWAATAAVGTTALEHVVEEGYQCLIKRANRNGAQTD